MARGAQGVVGRLGSGITGAYRYAAGPGRTTFVIIALALAVFAALAYTVYQILSTNLKVVTLMEEPTHAITNPKTISSDKFPTWSNGKEFSLSFWVYIESPTNSQNLKRVLAIGTGELSPLVLMDRSTNRMYIGMRTAETDTSVTTKQAIENFITSKASNAAAGTDGPLTYSDCAILEIDYVPLARWCNIVVVLNNDTLTLYLDGDIYSVAPVKRFAPNGVVADPAGALAVGGTTGVSGYVSNVQIANYALSVFHARSIYRAGPVKRTLAWLLPSNLKLQWPITTSTTD